MIFFLHFELMQRRNDLKQNKMNYRTNSNFSAPFPLLMKNELGVIFFFFKKTYICARMELKITSPFLFAIRAKISYFAILGRFETILADFAHLRTVTVYTQGRRMTAQAQPKVSQNPISLCVEYFLDF